MDPAPRGRAFTNGSREALGAINLFCFMRLHRGGRWSLSWVHLPITNMTTTPTTINLDAALADLERRRALADAAIERATAADRRAEAERVVAWEAYKAAVLAAAPDAATIAAANAARKIAERKANAASGRRSAAYTRRINLRINMGA